MGGESPTLKCFKIMQNSDLVSYFDNIRILLQSTRFRYFDFYILFFFFFFLIFFFDFGIIFWELVLDLGYSKFYVIQCLKVADFLRKEELCLWFIHIGKKKLWHHLFGLWLSLFVNWLNTSQPGVAFLYSLKTSKTL